MAKSREVIRVLSLLGALAAVILFYVLSKRSSVHTPPSHGEWPTSLPSTTEVRREVVPGPAQGAPPLPVADSRNFVALEPGFKVRKDKLHLVETAREEMRRARQGVAAAAAELLAIARARDISIDPAHPLVSFTAALDKLHVSSPDDAERVDSLLEKLQEFDSLKPAGYPFAFLAPPSDVLGLLEAFSESANVIEKRFWLNFLSREIQIAPIIAYDTDSTDGSSIVEQNAYGIIIGKLEDWMARPGTLKGVALDLLTSRLSKSCEGYGEIASRLGEKVLSGLAAGEVEGAGFIRSHLTTELRALILSRLLEAKDAAQFTRLAVALPIRPNGEEAALLGDRLLASEGALQRSILSLLTDRWGTLTRLGDSEPRVREVLDRVEKVILAFPETFGAAGARYLIARLQTTSSSSNSNEAFIGGLRAAAASLTDEQSRLDVVAYLSGLHIPQSPTIVAALALSKSDQAAEASASVLVKLLCEDGVSTADDALAGVLEAGSPRLVSAAISSLQVRGALPKDAIKTLAAIRQIAQGSSRSAEVQKLAQDYLSKTGR